MTMQSNVNQVGALLPANSRASRVLAVNQGAITGTGAIVTGLNVLDVGGFSVTTANSLASVSVDIATGVSVSAGSVTVVNWHFVAITPVAIVSTAAFNLNVIATGTPGGPY